MNPRIRRLILALTAGSVFAYPACAEELTATRSAELLKLLRQNCAGCHGQAFQGGLASPLDRAAIDRANPVAFRDAILKGLPGTEMAAYGDILSETEVDWLISVLREERWK